MEGGWGEEEEGRRRGEATSSDARAEWGGAHTMSHRDTNIISKILELLLNKTNNTA